MTAWTTVSDSNLAPGDPIRSIDIIAIKDNISAMAEGSSGAPKIQTAAYDTASVTAAKLASTASELSWLVTLYLTAGAGGIGTYMFATDTSFTGVTFGSNIAGSSLKPINAGAPGLGGPAQSGTWKCMGLSVSAGSSVERASTLWWRIA